MGYESKGIVATEPIVFDDELKREFIERVIVEQDRHQRHAQTAVGYVKIMRELGVKGTRGQIRAAIEAQLGDELEAVKADVWRDAVYERGVVGWEEPVFYKGEVVGTVHKWSDRALEIGARNAPEYRGDIEVNGRIVGAIEIEGRVQLGFEELFRRRAELGLGDSGGLGSAGDRRALPAASDVLPDPAAD